MICVSLVCCLILVSCGWLGAVLWLQVLVMLGGCSSWVVMFYWLLTCIGYLCNGVVWFLLCVVCWFLWLVSFAVLAGFRFAVCWLYCGLFWLGYVCCRRLSVFAYFILGYLLVTLLFACLCFWSCFIVCYLLDCLSVYVCLIVLLVCDFYMVMLRLFWFVLFVCLL